MKKKVLLLVAAFAMCICASFARETYNVTRLPISGNYYLIKNTNSGTFIGGTGTGSDAVKHENAETNQHYHVFLVEGNNTDGFSFQQVASGLFVTHNNSWTGSYAEATNTNRQLFQIDNKTSQDFCAILKKTDDGAFANGIGYDNADSGSTLYFDKGEGAQNKWLFETQDVSTTLYSLLTALITEAQDFQSEITVTPEAEQEIGTYSQEKSEALTAAIDAVTVTSSSPTKTIAKDVAMIRDAFNALKASKNIFVNKLDEGEYYIKVGDYYFNNPGIATLANQTAIEASNEGLQEEINPTGDNQVFLLSIVEEVGRYSIFSTLDETGSIKEEVSYRHINEQPQYRDDWGDGDNNWRTLNIYFNGDKYAIQNAGSAGSNMWTFDGTKLATVAGSPEDDAHFIFEFIPAATVNPTRLPVAGGYYLIKNTNSETYIGGAGTGSDAVKHEDAETNESYHVFFIEGNNTDGFTFQQVASGLYITHNNSWTGSYAEATNTNRQLFQIDNQTNPDFCAILKKTDDGAFANGIGFDNADSGSTLYFDKGESAQNKWLFVAQDASTILYSLLTTLIADAQDFQSGITVSSEADQQTGTYSQEKSEALTEAIAAVTVTSSSSTKEIAADIAIVREALTQLKTSRNLDLNELNEGDYYIRVADSYFLNNPGIATLANQTAIQASNEGLQEDINLGDKNQIFKISIVEEVGRYSIFSTLDETGSIKEGVSYRHINEQPQFRDDWSDADNNWRTLNIYFNGDKYAIQNAGSAGSNMWTFDGTKLATVGAASDDDAYYIFEFIPVADAESYLANSQVSIQDVDAVPFQVLSVIGGVKVICGEAQVVKVYNVTGQLVKQVNATAGETTVSLMKGIYIINGKKAIVK